MPEEKGERAAPAAGAAESGGPSGPASGPASGRGRVLEIRERIPDWMAVALGVIPILLLLLLWFIVTWGPQAETRIISPTILPSPVEVVRSFPELWFDRALMRNLIVSLMRVIGGFAIAVAVAFPLGLFMGSFTKIKAAFTPLSVFGAYLPIPTLVPLTLSLFGTGEMQKLIFLALAFTIYVLPLVVASVDGVDDMFLKTAYTLGATRWQAVRKVLLPMAWPGIYKAMRMGFGVGWSYILLAEMVDMGKGLGGLILTSQRQGPREHIYLILVVIVLVAFLTDKIWAVVGKRLFPYQENGR